MRPVLALLFACGLAATTVAVAQSPADAFVPESVPESAATLPPFPFFETPEGLTPLLAGADSERRFDRAHMIAGGAVIAVEGRIWYQRYLLANPDREYSGIEFQRNYADAIAALGGAEVSTVQYTDAVNEAFGGREAVDRHYLGTCAGVDCDNHTYLIRQGGKEWWIQVSSGAFPLHGEVVVLERQAMASRLAYLDAAAMGQTLAKDGRVALYINFDVDKATLRPDAMPVVNEIVKLLNADPSLKLSIEGHTDDTGSNQRNLELSKQRADTVVAMLVAFGIDAGRLDTVGHGEDRPLVAGTDADSRAQNRRVELVKR
jgi:OOP family OmpA-OmpF porin